MHPLNQKLGSVDASADSRTREKGSSCRLSIDCKYISNFRAALLNSELYIAVIQPSCNNCLVRRNSKLEMGNLCVFIELTVKDQCNLNVT